MNKLPILMYREKGLKQKSPFSEELVPATPEVTPFVVAADRSNHVGTDFTKVEQETTDDE